MASSELSQVGRGLALEVAHWKRAEEENRELNDRIDSALEEIRSFIGERRADLEKRKARLLQTGGFRDETSAMESALAAIDQMLGAGRNISRLFAEIDRYLKLYRVDDTLSRLHTRVQLADARDEFMCAFHDAIRGTKLAELLAILHFMPFAYWRSRGPEQRNYRSPSAAEILSLLEAFRRRKIDADRMDTVQLAAVIRLQLGITPRMNYHRLSANRLAEQLTDAETLTRFTAKALPLDDRLCRTASGILANIRRWSAELLADAGVPPPGEIEAEMLQVVFLAGETIRISGTERERAADFLWLLSTVVASDHATLKDTLAWPSVRNAGHATVYERILGTKTYLDQTAVLADRILAARWVEAREELAALAMRSDVISSKSSHDFAEFTELEQLKERRSDLGKSLIKIADSLQLLEPAVLDMLSASGERAAPPSIDGHLRTLDPGRLIDRNRSYGEETRQIARQELERLRALIGRIAEIGRKGFAASAGADAPDRLQVPGKPVRRTSDGVELGGLPAAEVRALLPGALRKALVSLQDCRGKLEGARKRVTRSDLLHALNVFGDKFRKAADVCDKTLSDVGDADLALTAAETMVPVLREVLAAHTNLGSRVANAKLPPAEKQPLANLLFAVKAKLNDDLRDIESLRAELAERPAVEEAAAPAAAAEEPPAARMAELAAAANRTLKPVKDQLASLGDALSDPNAGTAAIRAAAHRLEDAVRGAREVMTENRALIETLAATGALPSDAHAEKFDRWLRQLEAVGAETGRLLRAADLVAEFEESRSPQRLREAREACAAAAGAKWRVLKGAAGYLGTCASALDA
jgi:hypothetical protein